MRYTQAEPTQFQVSKSLPEAILNVGLSSGPLLEPGLSYPFIYRGWTPAGMMNFGPSYFIDAPNVTHGWNIRNASQIIRNIEYAFDCRPYEPNGELEYTIEYQIKSAGVPILIAYEQRFIEIIKGESRHGQIETSINYEPVRAQYIIPGTGVEISMFFRNPKVIRGEYNPGEFQLIVNNTELNLNVERL